MIEGKKKYGISNTLTVGIYNNGMHYATIRDINGEIESVITRKTSNELWKSLKEDFNII